MRVPALIWSPQRFTKNRMVDDLYQLMDVGPTILEIAGVRVPLTLEAISMLSVLEARPAAEAREFVFAEHGRDDILQGVELMSMVRSKNWKLVYFLGSTTGQLFNLEEDPLEICNLWSEAKFATQKQALLDVIRDWLLHSHYRTKEWKSDWR
jgi:arylsulfatase